jgi:hypothetical protein
MPTVTLGVPIDAALASTDCPFGDGTFFDGYRLQIAATTNVQIDMTSTTLDAYLELHSVVGSTITRVAADNSSGGGTNARIVQSLAPGLYVVVANSFIFASGAYRLTVTQLAAGTNLRSATESPSLSGPSLAVELATRRLKLTEAAACVDSISPVATQGAVRAENLSCLRRVK